MSASAMTGSWNLALFPPADRMLIEADKTACLIRHKCKGFSLEGRRTRGRELLAAVPQTARDAVVEQLKARANE